MQHGPWTVDRGPWTEASRVPRGSSTLRRHEQAFWRVIPPAECTNASSSFTFGALAPRAWPWIRDVSQHRLAMIMAQFGGA